MRYVFRIDLSQLQAQKSGFEAVFLIFNMFMMYKSAPTCFCICALSLIIVSTKQNLKYLSCTDEY